MSSRTRGLVAVAVAVIVLGGTWAIAQEQGVDVADDAFAPATIEVTEGDTVVWTQSGSNPHTVTADDGSFDSHPDCQTFADAAEGNCMDQGDTYEQTFTAAGEVGYHCRIHGSPGAGMAGTVVVQAAEEPEEEAEPEEDAEPAEDDAATEEEDPAEEREEADEEEPRLADTGASWALLALGVLLLGGGLFAVRHARARMT